MKRSSAKANYELKNLFTREVYSIVASIPRGKVLTYGQIAWLTGHPNHSRLVGHVLRGAAAELNLPCHRVVNSQGRTAPCWPEQTELLKAEGVTFKRNGCVDMEKHSFLADKLTSQQTAK